MQGTGFDHSVDGCFLSQAVQKALKASARSTEMIKRLGDVKMQINRS